MNAEQMRDLDAWIAENVMGWKIHTSGRGNIVATQDLGGKDERDYIVVANHPFDKSDFSPTADPAAAMMVLERCAGKIESHQGLSIVATLGGFSISVATSVDYEPDDYTLHSEGKTLPLAIALFAQKLFTK